MRKLIPLLFISGLLCLCLADNSVYFAIVGACLLAAMVIIDLLYPVTEIEIKRGKERREL